MTVDLWYKGERINSADCTFYPNSGIYAGNLYNAAGRVIGDYTTRDSLEIAKRFPGIFGR